MKVEVVTWCERCRNITTHYFKWDDTPAQCIRCDSVLLRRIPRVAADVRLQIPNAVHGRQVFIPLGLQFNLPVCRSRWDAVAALNKLANDLERVWAKTDQKS